MFLSSSTPHTSSLREIFAAMILSNYVTVLSSVLEGHCAIGLEASCVRYVKAADAPQLLCN